MKIDQVRRLVRYCCNSAYSDSYLDNSGSSARAIGDALDLVAAVDDLAARVQMLKDVKYFVKKSLDGDDSREATRRIRELSTTSEGDSA